MIAEDVAFLLVVLVPLFAARWRISLLGLALQGVLLYRAASGGAEGASAFDLVDFVALRALVGPVLLFAIQLRSGHAQRHDVVPANLIAWLFVVVLATGAFRFAAVMGGDPAFVGRIGVATTALVLGLFVLSTQNSTFSQIVGVLRIENAVALFEIALPRAHPDPIVRLAQLGVSAAALGLVAWYLRALHDFVPEPEQAPE